MKRFEKHTCSVHGHRPTAAKTLIPLLLEGLGVMVTVTDSIQSWASVIDMDTRSGSTAYLCDLKRFFPWEIVGAIVAWRLYILYCFIREFPLKDGMTAATQG